MPAVITDIRPDDRDPNLRHVLVDGTAAATVRETDVDTLGLEAGQAWTNAVREAVEGIVAGLAARRDGLAMLARAGSSRQRLAERLTRRGYTPETAARVVEQLVDEGWLDEEAHARSLAEEVVRRQPGTPKLVASRLKSRGIEAATAVRVAEDLLSGQDPLTAATELARRRLAELGPIGTATAARRIAGLLSRRGFDDDTIANVLERIEVADASF